MGLQLLLGWLAVHNHRIIGNGELAGLTIDIHCTLTAFHRLPIDVTVWR